MVKDLGQGMVYGATTVTPLAQWTALDSVGQENAWTLLKQVIIRDHGGTGEHWHREVVYGVVLEDGSFWSMLPGYPTHVMLYLELSP